MRTWGIALVVVVIVGCARNDVDFGKDCDNDDDCAGGYVCDVDVCVPDGVVVGDEGEGDAGEGEGEGEGCAVVGAPVAESMVFFLDQKLAVTATAGTTTVFLEFYTPRSAGTFDFGTPENAQYATCTECLLASIGDKFFIAQSGTVTVTDSIFTESFVATVTDARFLEVTFGGPDNITTTVVDDGACLTLARWRQGIDEEGTDCAAGDLCVHTGAACPAGGFCDTPLPLPENDGDVDGCTLDADCTSGELCRAVLVDGFEARRCGAAIGPGAPGSQCSETEDCATGLPGGRLCSRFCDSNADCPANMTCNDDETLFFEDEDVHFHLRTAKACGPRTDLGRLPCFTDADCAARGQTCTALEVLGDDEVSTPVCGDPTRAAAAGLGESCVFGLESGLGCESGFCDSFASNGVCIDLCTADSDCAGGMICTAAPFGSMLGRWCAEPCVDDDGCGFDPDEEDSRICRRRCDDTDPVVANRKFELSCSTPVGDRLINADLVRSSTPCTTDAQCETTAGFTCDTAAGFCQETNVLCRSNFSIREASTGDVYCSGPCNDDGDCNGARCAFDSNTTCAGVPDGFTYCVR